MWEKVWRRYLRPILILIVLVIALKLMVLLFNPETQTGARWRGVRFLANYGLVLIPIALFVDLIVDFTRNRRGQ